MFRLAFPAAVTVLVTLTACAVPPDAAPPTAEPVDLSTCGGEAYLPLVGRNVAAVTLPEGRGLRVIGPDDSVTMDFSPSRLNIVYDELGIITRVYCG